MSSKIRRGVILPLMAACPLLTACDGWRAVGVRLDPPEAVFAQPCPHPADLATARDARADWEILAGRLGDALIDCETRRAGLAQWAAGTGTAIKGE